VPHQAEENGARNDDVPAAAWADRSLRESYDSYVAKGYVVHSLTITTALNAAGAEKKKPLYGGVRWARDASTFADECNSIQIDCGRSNLIVLDVDLPALAAWAGIEKKAGGPFDTFTVRTGSGGLHLYFEAFDDDQLNRSVAKCFTLNGAKLDIDLRGRGGCIFAPPSRYTTLTDERRSYIVIKDSDVIPMPPRLVNTLKSLLQPAGRGTAEGRSARNRQRAGGEAPEALDNPRMTPDGACQGACPARCSGKGRRLMALRPRPV
jgi:hypothetical protein